MVAVKQNCWGTDPSPEEESIGKQFCANLVNSIKDGGLWAVPRSGTIFEIDKKNKRLVMIVGTAEEFAVNLFWFAKIGWDVVLKQKEGE